MGRSQVKLLLAAVLILGLTFAADAARKGGKKNTPTVQVVNTTIAQTKLGLKTSTWLDVRTDTLYKASHIPGAINLPFNLVRQAINLGKPRTVPATKDIICYEATTDKAVTACTYFFTSGKYTNVTLWALEGGFPAWQKAGLKVEP